MTLETPRLGNNAEDGSFVMDYHLQHDNPDSISMES